MSRGGGLSRAPAPTFDCYGLLCRKIATLFADLHLLRARVGGADFVLRYYIYNSTYFLLLFSLNLHLVGLRRMRLCLKLRKGLCPLSLRFISRYARCCFLLYACSFLWSALLIPHSSLLTPHSSLLTLLALPLDETTVK